MSKDLLQIVYYVLAFTISIVGLIVSIRAGFVRRDYWASGLRFVVGFGEHASWKEGLPWRIRRKPLNLVSICIEHRQSGPFIVPLTVMVRNTSRRKSIKDVVIELTYPVRFLVNNSALKKEQEKSLAFMRKSGMPTQDIEDNYQAFENYLSRRDTYSIGDLARVRQHVEVLRPGEAEGFWEPIRITTTSGRQRNSGISSPAYRLIAERIREIDGVLDHCVVTYAAFAENYAAKPRRISLCILRERNHEKLEKFGSQYALAHWFGRYPQPGIYFTPVFPAHFLFGRTKRSLELCEFMMVHEEKLHSIQQQSATGAIAVTTMKIEPLKSELAYMILQLPPYDYYELPDSISTPEAALAHIGWKRLPTSKELRHVIARAGKMVSTAVHQYLPVGTHILSATIRSLRDRVWKKPK